MTARVIQMLQAVQRRHRVTLLGVGPMSRNCVDAAVSVADRCIAPLMLIASRRQVDAAEFGGGYVENWTTDEFCKYVKRVDKNKRVVLARDHGGPWQSTTEVAGKLSTRDAMESAKRSYEADISAGMEVIHIDTSVDVHGPLTAEAGQERLEELYSFCVATARKLGLDIAIEVGTEEQSGTAKSPDDLDRTLLNTLKFCEEQDLPPPTFVVVQTGTKVAEMENVGSFDEHVRQGRPPTDGQIPRMLEICDTHTVMMKAHNADYLSDEALSWHRRLGIHAANVAPEFGVVETRSLLKALRRNHMEDLADEFLTISYASGKWEKWMLPETTASDEEKAVIAGHYVFSHPAAVEVIGKARRDLLREGIDLDRQLRDGVAQAIERYARSFGLLSSTRRAAT